MARRSISTARTAGGLDIPVGGFIECRYTVTAQSSLVLAGSHTNTIDADWSSLNATSTGERVYDDSVARPVDGTQDTASASFTSGAPTFAKSDGGVTQLTIGETLTYTLTITSPLGTLRNLVITDTLPAGLIYATGSYVVSGIGTAPTFSASAPNDGSAPVVLRVELSAMRRSPAARRGSCFAATVANVLGNQQGVSADQHRRARSLHECGRCGAGAAREQRQRDAGRANAQP